MSEVELRDGSKVEIRPLGPADKQGLSAGFERLSELSRYRRFLSPTSHLTAKQLAYLTEIDHRDHEALVAIEPSSRDGLGVRARPCSRRGDARGSPLESSSRASDHAGARRGAASARETDSSTVSATLPTAT